MVDSFSDEHESMKNKSTISNIAAIDGRGAMFNVMRY